MYPKKVVLSNLLSVLHNAEQQPMWIYLLNIDVEYIVLDQ